jgi:hypothetical protein
MRKPYKTQERRHVGHKLLKFVGQLPRVPATKIMLRRVKPEDLEEFIKVRINK